MRRCVLGIDGGGTKTVCALADTDGRIIGRGSGGTANLNMAATSEIKASLHKAIQEAIQDNPEIQIETVCAGIAGVGVSEEKRAAVGKIIWQILGVPPFCHKLSKGFMPSLHIEVVSDVIITLVAGARMRHGMVAISGTGAVVYGETLDGQKVKVGGWGYLLDAGSGYEIGRMALQEILRAYDVHKETTILARLVLHEWCLHAPRDLINHVYRQTARTADIANLAKVVNQAAGAGDDSARDILKKAANGLYSCISGAVMQIDFGKEGATLVLSGGVLANIEIVREIITERVLKELPAISSIHVCNEPVKGAVALALKKAGNDVIRN